MTTLCLLKSSGRVLAYNWEVVTTSGFKTLYLVSNKKFLHTFLAKENFTNDICKNLSIIFSLECFNNVPAFIMCFHKREKYEFKFSYFCCYSFLLLLFSPI